MTEAEHIVIIGGGIAGVTAAYHLALQQAASKITLVEAESQLAHHTTGRSAALLTENYGAGPVRPLTTASLDFLHNPPPELVDHKLLHRRGIMVVATHSDDYATLDKQLDQGRDATQPVFEISLDEAAQHAPHIRLRDDHRVMWEPHAYDIDVGALHQAFVRGARARGVEIRTSHRVNAATRSRTGYEVVTAGGTLHADLLVNASGAWGDLVATSAGVEPVGLQPMRRTAFMVSSPFEDSDRYAFVAEANHRWYMRPDGTQFMCSPADETPSEPCDARAEEVDIARTIELINANTHLDIRSVNSHWAGLRTFAPDRAMVIGPDPTQPDFYWFVGQGGTGIQTSPGAGRLLADLVCVGAPSDHFATTGLDVDLLKPARLRPA